MSSKKCAKCEKTVYPIEEVKCLDKLWHKACFKCDTCNMTLNMKNYKGFDKIPYCGAHVPKAKATIVSDTPEMKRLAENSKIQSNVKYHADFKATKGKFTTIVDDPETVRLKANSQAISNISYHGVAEQKALQEEKRCLVNTKDTPSQVKTTSLHLEQSRPPNQEQLQHQQMKQQQQQQQQHQQPRQQQIQQPVRQQQWQQQQQHLQQQQQLQQQHQLQQQQQLQKQQQQQQYYTSRSQPNAHYLHGTQQASQEMKSPATQVHRIGYQTQHQAAPHAQLNRCFQAMYDYEAQDSDEVSFKDGDVIINCTIVDEGWMTGMVHRTGEYGMIPANYVEAINL